MPDEPPLCYGPSPAGRKRPGPLPRPTGAAISHQAITRRRAAPPAAGHGTAAQVWIDFFRVWARSFSDFASPATCCVEAMVSWVAR